MTNPRFGCDDCVRGPCYTGPCYPGRTEIPIFCPWGYLIKPKWEALISPNNDSAQKKQQHEQSGGGAMTPHQQRCETCGKRATDDCPLSTVANNIGRHGDYDRIVSVITLVGCASHSAAAEPVPDAELKDMPTKHDKERYMQGYRAGTKQERERVIDAIGKQLQVWRDGLEYPRCPPGDTYDKVLKFTESLRAVQP